MSQDITPEISNQSFKFVPGVKKQDCKYYLDKDLTDLSKSDSCYDLVRRYCLQPEYNTSYIITKQVKLHPVYQFMPNLKSRYFSTLSFQSYNPIEIEIYNRAYTRV